MMCFKYLLPYAFLLPIPSASPMFMLVFVIQLVYAVRPCMYCLGLLAVVFLSASPSSPFTTLTYPARPSHSATGDSIPLTQPVRQSWFELNNGYWFDPVLHAFSPNATITTPEETGSTLPKGFLDLRYRGVGFILDFGLTRTDEELGWEMADRQAAAAATAGKKEKGQEDAKEPAEEVDEAAETSVPAPGTWRERVMGSLRFREAGTGSILGDW